MSCGAPLKGVTADESALPPGTKLSDGAYTVGRILGKGGTAITYLGSSVRLQRPVAIKEFFPSDCERIKGRVVPTLGEWSKDSFLTAKQKFLDEGRMLARFNHPGIVRVYQVFEENDTAYIVMEALRGKDLETVLLANGGPLPESEVMGYFVKLTETLELVHRAGLLHRDIKPQNIIHTDNDRVVLVDFGAATELNVLQSSTVTVSSGYAPLEMYSEDVKEGPFSDVYACAATLYHLLTGAPPAPAIERAVGIELESVRDLNPQVSERVANAIMQALSLHADDRPNSVAAFRILMMGKEETEAQPVPPPPPMPVSGPAPPAEAAPPRKTVLMGHAHWVHSLVFTPDDKFLVSASDDMTVRVWDMASRKEVRVLRGHTNWVRSVDMRFDGLVVASGSRDSSIRLWDLKTGQENRRLEDGEGVLCVSFSPDGGLLADARWDSTILLWNVLTGKVSRRLTGHEGPIAAVDFSPNALYVASAGLEDQTARMWEVESGSVRHVLTGHEDWMSDVSFSPDGKTLATAAHDATVRLWDTSNGKLLRTVELEDAVLCCRFAPSGRTLACGTLNNSVSIIDTSTGDEIRRVDEHEGPVCAVAFDTGGKYLASASYDKSVRLIEL